MKFILFILISFNSHAFTLNTNIDANFSGDTVKIYVTSNSSCTNAGISNTELLDIAVDGANKFWNRVSTSYLRIKKGGILNTTDSKYTSGILCVTDSDSSCDASTSIPKVNQIVIACNSDTTKNFPSSSYYALTVPNNFSNKKIKGSMIIINDSANTVFDQLSREEMVNVLGHELGHAIGIGHTQVSAALMYSSRFSNRERLGQDDIDAVTYLYPNKLHGCTGIFGTIKTDQKGPPTDPLNFILTLIFSMLAVLIVFKIIKNITSFKNSSGHEPAC